MGEPSPEQRARCCLNGRRDHFLGLPSRRWVARQVHQLALLQVLKGRLGQTAWFVAIHLDCAQMREFAGGRRGVTLAGVESHAQRFANLVLVDESGQRTLASDFNWKSFNAGFLGLQK